MHRYVVRTVALLALATAAACGTGEVGSSKLDDIKIGSSRADVMSKLGTGPLTAVGADSARLKSGFRYMRYFNNGKNFEVIYFREQPGSVGDPVEQKIETPIVLADDKVLGTGWKFYVEAMTTYGLPTPLMGKVIPPPATPAPRPGAPARSPGADSLAKKM